MSQVRWSRLPGLVVVPALAALAVAGCSNGGSSSHTAQAADDNAANASTTSTYTAAQLRNALIGKINGEAPAAPVESGAYGSLAEVKATKDSMKGVKVTPSKCAQSAVTGFNSPAFAGVPASVSTFRVGNNGISEVLLSPSSSTAAQALAKQVPDGCSTYKATVDGKTFTYTVKEQTVQNVAKAARAMNIKASGSQSIDVWSVVYKADNFVGAVTIVGPNASQAVATALANQAYTHAAKSLH
jgi:hypothetical protein